MNGVKILLLSAFLLCCSAPGNAAHVMHFQLPELVRQSHLIVHGRIVGIHAAHVGAAARRIERTVTVTPTQFLKGASNPLKPRTVSFVMAGGIVGRFGQHVPGLPQLRKGDRGVFFLYRRPIDGSFVLTGMAQGFYAIYQRRGGVLTAVSHRHGMQLLSRGPGGQLIPAPQSALLDEQPLSKLIALIRQHVELRK
jgi:hypothetical protein